MNEAQLKVSEAEGVATYKQKLDVLKEQEELIEDELEQEASEKARKQEMKEQEAAVKKAKEQLRNTKSSQLLEPADIEVPIPASVPGTVEEDEIVSEKVVCYLILNALTC